MRRIISLLVMARLIQRLVNGSRSPAMRQTSPSRNPQAPTEPPQGGPAQGGQTGEGRREKIED